MADPAAAQVGRPAPAPSRRFLLGVLLLLLALSFYVVRPFLAATLFALLFGYLLQGLMAKVERRVRSRRAAAAILLLGVGVAIVLPVVFITDSLLEQAMDVAETLESPEAVRANVADALTRLGVPEETAADLPGRGIEAAAGFVQGALVPTLNAALEFFAGLIVFFFLLYYVLLDWPRLQQFAADYAPLAPRHRQRLFHAIDERVRAIMLGAFLVSVIQGVAAGIGWWLLGFPNPVFWGFVMTLLAVLPFAGPILVMAPAAVFAILTGNTVGGIILLVYAVIVVGLVDNFARPYVVGRRADVHPALVLLGTLGGLVVFGVSGFVLGPLVVSLVGPVLEAWHDASTGDGVTPEEAPSEELPPDADAPPL